MSDAWAEWLASPASAFGCTEAELHAVALLGLLRQSPSVELLERVLVGDNLVEVDRRTCRKDQAAAEVEAWKARHDVVRVEARPDTAPSVIIDERGDRVDVDVSVYGVPVVDVVAYARAPNLFELTRDREIARLPLVTQLEQICRELLPDDRPAGLRLGRQIFQVCLLTGKPPKTHHVPPAAAGGAVPARRTVEPWHSGIERR